MNVIKYIVREVISEIFDNINTIEYNQKKVNNDFICTFQIDNIEYAVIFRLFKDISKMYAKDKKIKNIIENTKEKYYIDFGVNTNGVVDTKNTTGFNKPNSVINAVSYIVSDFIKKNNIDIIAYFADSKRKKIYKNIFNKHLDSDFIFYSEKFNSDIIPIFYINKKLL